MQHLEYREDIDLLRGLAVLLVVLYHGFPDWLPGGYIGVDVFFVISGYLITSIILRNIEKEKFSLVDFYSRRVRRLFPALITVIFFSLTVGWFVLFPTEYEQLGTHVSRGTIFWLNFTFINEVGYFDVESIYKPLLHLWSLSVEEQYYIIWPVTLLLFLKYTKQPLYLFGSVFILSLAAYLYFSIDYPQETYFHTLTRFWQLSTGSLLATWGLRRQLDTNNLLFPIGIGFIVLSAIIFDSNTTYPGILPVLGTVMVIMSNSKLSNYIGLSKLGLISYPLYLWHWVLISFAYIYIGREPSEIILLSLILLSIVLSALTYVYIEPLRYNKKSTKYLIGAFILLGLAGIYIDKEKGIDSRSSLNYLSEVEKQFKRAPAKDIFCEEYLKQLIGSKPEVNYCRANNVKARKVVALIGDSHAHAFYPGFSKTADKYGLGTILLANSSCPPFKGFRWGRNQQEKQSCQQKIHQIMAVLEKDPRIETVVILSRGPVYIHGDVDGEFNLTKISETETISVDGEQTYDSLFNSFQETIALLANSAHINKIYYMLENPELDFHPKEVLPRPYDYFDISTNRNYIRKNFYIERMRTYRSGINRVHHEKLIILDPMDAFCGDVDCYSFHEGSALYADDDHFSKYGSSYVSSYFEDKVFSP